MVATADRSPARCIFELKLAEVPSGPLNSELMMFRPRQGHIECDRADSGFGVLRLPSWLSEESIGPGALALPDHADGRRMVNGTYHELARPAWRATRAPEGFQVVRENGPHDSHFDSVQSLPQQHPAYVGLRCVEFGGSLGDG
jgi:hypothetical protein